MLHRFIGIGIATDNNNVTIYNVFNNTRILDKSVRDLNILYNPLVINICSKHEKIFINAGVETISLSTLISVLTGYPLSKDDYYSMIRKACRCDLKVIKDIVDTNDLKELSYQWSVWKKFCKAVRECMIDIIMNGSGKSLRMEIEVLPALYSMFSLDYPVDVCKARQLYEKLIRENQNDEKKYLIKYGGKIKSSLDLENQYVVNYRKRQDKLRRFPDVILSNSDKNSILVKSSFKSIGTKTFRITTSEYNIQGFSKELRKCMLPRFGDILIEYDIKSSQLLILAILAEESKLLEEYCKGKDLYILIISVFLGIPINTIDSVLRKEMKKILLKMMYGASLKTIRADLNRIGWNMSIRALSVKIKDLYKAFPNAGIFVKEIKKAGSYILPSGRKISIDNGINPRTMLACILQGAEADVLKEILIKCYREFTKEKNACLYLCIHDSVFVDTLMSEKKTNIESVKTMIKKVFYQYFDMKNEIEIQITEETVNVKY